MFTDCAYREEDSTFAGAASIVMGTRLELVICGLQEEASRRLWNAIITRFAELEKVFNRFDPESGVSVWNSGRHENAARELVEAIQLCGIYKERTGGVFDIAHAGLLDFGGFAKGYALKWAGTFLRAEGAGCAFVNFGNSSILAIGEHPGGGGWKVSLPNPWTGLAVDEFSLTDTALSVSGNSPKYVGHIVNPLTGQKDISRKMSSVVCRDPLDAEILSTAAIAATPAQSEAIRAAFPEAEITVYG